MRDYRMPFMMVIPAAIAVVAVWMVLRKKSGKDGKGGGKPRASMKKTDTEITAQSPSEAIEKEGITITQRKIPETQARDRGDAALCQPAPDITGGFERNHRPSSAPKVVVNGGLHKGEEDGLTEAVLDTKKQHDGLPSLTTGQLDQVEKMVMSAMGDGLQEATTKLVSSHGIMEGAFSASVPEDDGEDVGSPESFDCSLSVESLPADKVVTCSSIATIGFDVDESVVDRSGIEGATLSETAGLPVSEEISVKLASTSEAAAVGQSQCSPQQQAAYFPSMSLDSSCVPSSQAEQTVVVNSSPDLTDLKDSTSPSGSQPQTTTCLGVTNEDTTDLGVTEKDAASSSSKENVSDSQTPKSSGQEQNQSQVPNTGDGDTASSQESVSDSQTPKPLGQEQINHSQVPNTDDGSLTSAPAAVAVLKRQKTLMSKSSLESQASLGPEEIDSLWGIKPSCGASANWDKQLSLDDPLSSLARSPGPAQVSDEPSTSSTPALESGSSSCSTKVEPKLEASEGLKVACKDSALGSSPSEGGKEVECPLKANSPVCDSNSEGSNDSGRGGSEHETATGNLSEVQVQFDFNMPSDLCGRFIGRHGKNINFIKSRTGARIFLTNNPFSADYQICQVKGTQTEIDSALVMIRRKFPLQDFPMLTMVPISVSSAGEGAGSDMQHPVIVPDVMQLSLPEGVSVEVYVSAIVDAGHVFVQQPTHRSFMSLEKLTYCLNTVYGQDPNVPSVPTPVECGVICVVENEGYWYRAMIMTPEDDNGEAQIKFVDYGGYASMPISALKQIRTDFMTLPFQAVECFMANITPLQGEDYFNEEATTALSELTNCQLLQCQVVARSENGLPYVHLYHLSPGMSTAVLINRALVNNQQARWVEIL